VRKIRDELTAIGFADPDFRTSDKIRLHVLNQHLASGRLSPSLRWLGSPDREKQDPGPRFSALRTA
jgi:hypothetical protein